MLSLDPRPAYTDNADPGRIYGFRIMDVDVRWRVEDGKAIVTAIEPGG